LIRSSNHSSFPRVGESPLDQEVRLVLKRQQAGKATEAEVSQVIDEVITIVVAQQSRAFIDIVTDGMVRWDGPLSHLAKHVDGMRTAELFRWFDTNFYDRRVEITGPLGRKGSFLQHDYDVANDVALKQTVKQVLPGPVTFARMSRDTHYNDRAELARALADVLAEEVAELAAHGVDSFQLDEPLLCRHSEDVDLVIETAGKIFAAAGPDSQTVLSTYFGDLHGIGDRIADLPGTHVGLDMLSGHDPYAQLARIPDGKGVALGLFDARTTVQEDAADVAALLEPHRKMLTARDVIVGPNAGLELLPRDQAFDKLLHPRYLVEKLTEDWTWD
jgi:5-methyltetrahydropteroyltriglutamate--homocysteine methyltransferase